MQDKPRFKDYQNNAQYEQDLAAWQEKYGNEKPKAPPVAPKKKDPASSRATDTRRAVSDALNESMGSGQGGVAKGKAKRIQKQLDELDD